jgi:hypothetical protein
MQDAEMRAEINASIAMNGNWDDCADDYMHTPMQERLYQQSIEHSMRYDDDYGYFDDSGECSTCHATVYYDTCTYIVGYSVCEHCYNEARAFLLLLSILTNVAIEENGWGEINYAVQDWDQ